MEFDRSALVKKWKPVLDHEGLSPIHDSFRREVTAVLLENQHRENLRTAAVLNEAAPANSVGTYADTGGFAKFDPVLISLVRRAAPRLMAYDVCGVQPLTQPTGLIFAMKARYGSQSGAEALYQEANTEHSGKDQPGSQTEFDMANAATQLIGRGFDVGEGEALGTGSPNPEIAQMAFTIERVAVEAKTRKLKAEYSIELAQDMKAIHGLDADAELSNILSTEILAEINREVVRSIYMNAKPGAQVGTATAGVFDLDVDSSGRWSVEKFKGLLFQIEREANVIGQETRRGRGNFIICSADVASALQMAGVLDYAPALQSDLNVDDTASTFAGVLNGKFKVFIDPYTGLGGNNQFFLVGYKGSSASDAGLFYCPYTMLTAQRAVDPRSLQPVMSLGSRYGIVANPFSTGSNTISGALTPNTNVYYRRVRVINLL